MDAIRRLANIEADPRVSQLVDEDDDDSRRLWCGFESTVEPQITDRIEDVVEGAHRERYPPARRP